MCIFKNYWHKNSGQTVNIKTNKHEMPKTKHIMQLDSYMLLSDIYNRNFA